MGILRGHTGATYITDPCTQTHAHRPQPHRGTNKQSQENKLYSFCSHLDEIH